VAGGHRVCRGRLRDPGPDHPFSLLQALRNFWVANTKVTIAKAIHLINRSKVPYETNLCDGPAV
jgi:hypothetical protein